MRTHELAGALLLSSMLLAACGSPDEAARDAAPVEAAETASVSVALSYRERIALSPEAIAKASLIAIGPEGYEVVAEVSEQLDGRQAPIQLTIHYTPADLPGRGEVAVTGRITDPSSGQIWVTPQDARFAAANPDADLGMIILERSGHGAGDGAPRTYTCNDDSELTVRWLDPDLELEWQGGTRTLSPVIAASGARFEAGDPDGDDWIMFWSRGQHAMLGLPLQDPLSCESVPAPEPVLPAGEPAPEPVYTASGNEPGWLLRLSGDAAEYLGNYGEVRISGPVTEREALDEGVSRLTVEAADGIVLIAEIANERCSDTMTGVTYPDTVNVVLGEARFSGCGGDAESLLTGGAWTVTHVAGQEVPGPRAVTLEFDGQGRLAGQGPCNRYSASYQLTGEGLIISQGLSTRMACVTELMTLETVFLETLQGSLSTSIDEDGVLSLGEGRILAVRE